MGKEAKYFCEYCDAEVGENDEVCPRCGRHFSSIVCDTCGYSGVADEFARGCPKCGHAWKSRGEKEEPVMRKAAKKALPWWIFFLAGVVAASLAAVVFMRK